MLGSIVPTLPLVVLIGDYMKKIYFAQKTIDVVFVSDSKDHHLSSEAERFIVEESRNRVPNRLLIREVKSKNDIPEDWLGSLIYGTDDGEDINTVEALHKLVFSKDAEYKEYLRLKAKFE